MAFERTAGRAASAATTWRKATGPTLALWLSLSQLGWQWVGAHAFIDDLGREWDARKDPPCMLAQAAKAAVTRSRNRAIASQLPGLMPARSDIIDPQSVGRHSCIDLSHITARIAGGRVAKVKEVPEWKTSYSGYLRSAATGAQWTQTRRCMVPAFNLTDKRCQLCLGENGTAEHRWSGPSTTRADGWTEIPPRAGAVEKIIGARRTRLLCEHGLLTVAVPSRAWRKYDTFQWISQPPDVCRDDLVWYVDGSGFNTRWSELATYGFGIVVVSRAGDVIAWDNGTPPQWASSAAEAEAWAVVTTLCHSPDTPSIVTDCLSILQVA